MIRKALLAICVLAVLTAAPAFAGLVLDEILNYMFVDQTTLLTDRGELFKVNKTMNLKKDAPIGQTFITGPETDRIIRIRTWIDPDKEWQPGEGVELVLWDSPDKKVSFGRYTILYEFRGFQYTRPEFEINAKVQPNTQYYFELSYAGQGDGKLSRVGLITGPDSYKSGQGYLVGKEADFEVHFQTHVKRVPNRAANLRKMFALFDLSRPDLAEVKAAVDKGDFDDAQSRLVRHFETREKPTQIIQPQDGATRYDPNYDTTEGDLAMQNYFSSSEMGQGYAGPDINWRGEPDFNEDGSIAASFWNTGINRYGPRGPLTRAYLNTGNEKYVKKLNDVLIDWYLDNPPPVESRIGGDGSDPVWATLDAGTRVGAEFTAYRHIWRSPFFTLDGRMAFILNLANNADSLIQLGEGDGGNWSFTQNASMLGLALDYPEFTSAAKWQQTAIDRLAETIEKDILPDGVEMESAPGYQRMSYGPLVGVYKNTVEKGLTAPFAGELKSVLEKQAEYFMYLAGPDGMTPFLGDWGDSPRGPLGDDAKLFGRKDMLYVHSAGKEGVKPKELSKLYPYAGTVTMRSDWGDVGRKYEDARYLFLHGRYKGAHGHDDLNSITAYAYGKELLMDPGSYEYGSPEHAYLGTSPSHNLLTIDGQTQGKYAKGEFRVWSTTPVADYLSSWVTGYKSGDHNREVFYIRTNGDPGARDYWVIRDIADGTGEHSLEQRWHFGFKSEARVDKSTLTSTVVYPRAASLAIMQIDPSRLESEQTTAKVWRPRVPGVPATNIPVMIYKIKTALPAGIDTVLFPSNLSTRTMSSTPSIKTLEKSPDGLSSAFKMVQRNIEDLFILQKTSGPKSLSSEKVSFNGERLFLRRVGGKVRSLVLIHGSSVSVAGKSILKSPKPISWVSISFSKTRTTVYTSDKQPGLVVPGKKAKFVTTGSDGLIKTVGAK